MAGTDAAYRPRPVLEIVGPPRVELSIHLHGRDPWASIFMGRMPPNGSLRLKVPPAYLVIVAPGCAGAQAKFETGVDYLKVELVPC